MLLSIPTVIGPNLVFVVLTIYLGRLFELFSMFLAIKFFALPFVVHRKRYSGSIALHRYTLQVAHVISLHMCACTYTM